MKLVKNIFLSGNPIIAQYLSLVPKEIFNEVLEQKDSDRYNKKIKTADHFICMFYAVLTRNSSLMEVCKNIGLIFLKLIPFGMKQLPAKSTLSDANRKRDHKIFSVLYFKLFIYYKKNLQGNWLYIGREVDPGRVEVFDSTTGSLFKEILKGAARNP